MVDSAVSQQVRQQRVVSSLINLLDLTHERIRWGKYCWKDRQDKTLPLDGDALRLNPNDSDNSFTSTSYSASLPADVSLEYTINWDDRTSFFTLRFGKSNGLRLQPQPTDLIFFSHDPRMFSNAKPHLQATYCKLAGLSIQEAAPMAARDFVENGQRLAQYFRDMNPESVSKYLELVKRFEDTGISDGVVWAGFNLR